MTLDWQRWAAITLLDGYPLLDVLRILEERGIARRESVPYCARLYEDPVFQAGQEMASRLKKVESVLTVVEQMHALGRDQLVVDAVAGLSGSEFLEGYYSKNRPVVLTDACDQWAARRWTPEILVAKIGGAEVEVMAGRSDDPRYEINADRHRFVMPFDEFVAKVQAAEGNDLYLVANNKVLSTDAARPLWDDFDIDPRYMAPDPDRTQAFLWFGPAGTVTPLHHDTMNVMFNQVCGTKRFTLIPALSIHRMYNRTAVYSEVDASAPDIERFPLYSGAARVTIEVGPGQSLFIPAGWWHHVESLDTSVSISFTNFLWDNDFDWSHPEPSY